MLHNSPLKRAVTYLTLLAGAGCYPHQEPHTEKAPPDVEPPTQPEVIEPRSEATLPEIPSPDGLPLAESYLRSASGAWNCDFPILKDVELGPPSPKREELLRTPLTDVPGIALVEHPVNPENPAMRLIVMRDYHGVRFERFLTRHLDCQRSETPIITPEDRARMETEYAEHRKGVRKVQEHIKLALTYLSKEWGIREVYREGSTVESVQGHMEMLAELSGPSRPQLLHALAQEVQQAWTQHDVVYRHFLRNALSYPQYAAVLQKTLLTQRMADDFETLNASEEVFLAGDIDVIAPAEVERLFRAAVDSFEITYPIRKISGAVPLNAQLRESAFLGMATALERRGDGVMCLVIGAAHDFIDNVRAYNNGYYNQQIALTVLTPYGVGTKHDTWRHENSP